MKPTGVMRKMDPLGRVVPPMEYRQALGIQPGDLVEMVMEGDAILLRKQGCTFCGQTEDCTVYLGKHVCRACQDAIAAQREG